MAADNDATKCMHKSKLVGQWKYGQRFENIEALLDEADVREPAVRAMVASVRPNLEIYQRGDEWTLVTNVPDQSSRAITFHSGDELDYLSFTGRRVKAVLTVEGDTLREIHRDLDDPHKVTYITRYAYKESMHVDVRVGDVVRSGHYHRADVVKPPVQVYAATMFDDWFKCDRS